MDISRGEKRDTFRANQPDQNSAIKSSWMAQILIHQSELENSRMQCEKNGKLFSSKAVSIIKKKAPKRPKPYNGDSESVLFCLLSQIHTGETEVKSRLLYFFGKSTACQTPTVIWYFEIIWWGQSQQAWSKGTNFFYWLKCSTVCLFIFAKMMKISEQPSPWVINGMNDKTVKHFQKWCRPGAVQKINMHSFFDNHSDGKI